MTSLIIGTDFSVDMTRADVKSPRVKSAGTALLRGLFLFLLTLPLHAQTGDHSIALSVGYLDASQIFLYPQSSDPVLRDETADIGSSFCYAGGYRFNLYPSIAVQLHAEYVSGRSSRSDQVGTVEKNGFDVWLLEADAVFTLPFSTRRFQMYVGGGGGMYLGRRIHSIAGVSAETVSSTPAVGIHVLVGAEYMLTEHLAVRADIIFRDPQISVENRFPQERVLSNGVEYPLRDEPFRSHINLNGNVYSLGWAWYF